MISSKFTWIGVIVALLGMSVVIQGIALFAALSDPSFAVEPDYERKALEWDQTQKQRSLNQDLGWKLELRTTPSQSPGQVDVVLDIEGREGVPVTGAVVAVAAFHNARANRRIQGALVANGEGQYVATLPIRRAGIWEFQLRIEQGQRLYTETIRKSVATQPRPVGKA